MVMKDFGVTAICCTPSYFLHLIDRAAEMGVDIEGTAAARGRLRRRAVDANRCAGTSKSAAASRHSTSTGYRRSSGPGVGMRMPAPATGLHIFEDHFYPEIIDPETGEPLPDGEEGELVLTTLSKQAMPMIRYRTRDITALLPGRAHAAAPCGASGASAAAATTC